MILLHGFGDRGQDHIETEHRGFAMGPRCARHWPPHTCENEELTAGQARNSPLATSRRICAALAPVGRKS
jgi:hypothetical protein